MEILPKNPMELYPKNTNRFTLSEDKYNEHLKMLARYWMYRYASERLADGFEVVASELVEFTVDELHNSENLHESVYDWYQNKSHWIWELAHGLQDEIRKSKC